MRESGDSHADRTYETGEDIPLYELGQSESVTVEADNGEVYVMASLEKEADQFDPDIDQV